MTGVDLRTDWATCFGETAPSGVDLRVAYPGGWTRFYALPGGKRYAESEAEQREILARANRLGDALFGDGGSVWLIWSTVTTPWKGAAGPGPCLRPGEPVQRLRFANAIDERWARAAAGRTDWREGRFDDLILRIADDDGCAILFSAGQRAVLAPYDGGFDVISLEAAGLGDLKARFSDWASAREDGL